MASKIVTETSDHRVDSWKEIAAFFDRDERTVKRWEKERGLPVHRIPGGTRGSVFAFSGELTKWLKANQRSNTRDGFKPTRNLHGAHDALLRQPAETQERQLEAQLPAAFQRAPWFKFGFLRAAAIGALLVGVATFTALRWHGTGAMSLPSQPSVRQPAAAAQTRLAEEEKAHLLATSPGYEKYLLARGLLAKRDQRDLEKAEHYFGQAIAADPNLAPAYAALAECYTLELLYGEPVRAERAVSAAQKALQLDQNSAEAYNALGAIDAVFYWNWIESERNFRRAIEIDPAYGPAHHWYSTLCLAPLGRLDEALVQIQRAAELDPLSSAVRTDVGFVYYLRGEYAESARILREVLQVEPEFVPAHHWLGQLDVQMGKYGEAYAEDLRVFHLTDVSSALANRGMKHAQKAYEESGYPGFARAILNLDKEVNTIPERTYVAARQNLLLGNYDRAIAGSSNAVDDRDPAMLYVGVDPTFKPLRSNTQFRNVLRRMGFQVN